MSQLEPLPRTSRRSRRPNRRISRAISGLGLLAVALATPACDNPACVFAPNGCTGGGGGGANSVAAVLPVDHQWIQPAAPSITAKMPAASAQLHPDSPIAIVFSESMQRSSLAGAIELQDPASGGFGAPIQLSTALVCDGRVLVIIPVLPLTLGTTYDLNWTEDAQPVDLQGQELAIPSSRLIDSFAVAAAEPTTLRLLGSFPADGAANQSGTGEFLALFDRKLNPTSVTALSFDFTVGGVAPTFDPLPAPVSVAGPGGVAVSDTRAYLWRSIDGTGVASPLTPGLEVDCSLSPANAKLTAADGSQLVAQHVRYDIASLSPPLAAEIVSMPTDAIGIDNVTGPETLDVAVTLTTAAAGDRLGVFVFGNSVGANPKLIALFRETTLSGPALTVQIGEDVLSLANDAGEGSLADGSLNFAFRLQRGSVTTPLRLLDVDMTIPGVQAAQFDLQRPTLVGLGASGNNTSAFRSDLRDFALIGRASERIRACEVTCTLGNNGVLTPVVGSTNSGLFVAAPVALGSLSVAQMPLPFTAVLYDKALNASATAIQANFTQLGSVGNGNPLPGPTVSVEVFDAATSAPIANALVLVHEEVGGNLLDLDSDVTDAQGQAALTASVAGETFVTVEAAGYDLFTFEDVPTSFLSIPLSRSAQAPATVAGVVSSTQQGFSSFERLVVDSRRLAQFEPTIQVQGCTTNPITQSSDCTFGPSPIRAGTIGVTSMFAIETPPSELAYNVLSFLRAFQIAIPVAPVGAGTVSTVQLTQNTLLSDAGLDVEERGVDGPAPTLDLGSTNGLVLAQLDGDPRVLVDAELRGMPAAATVGMGVAFAGGGNTWQVRCAYPGAVDGIQDTPQDLLGKFVQDGVIDADLRLFCEVRDDLGARAGRRVRFSQLGGTLRPISAPSILAPAPGSNVGGAGFDWVFTNAITNANGTPGLYRATLVTSSGGRRWTLWRADLNDASGASRTIRVPDLAGLGGGGLANGTLTGIVEAFGWAGFTANDFHWSDVEREFDGISASAPSAFVQP